MAARVRHIALSVKNPQKSAEFFEKAFGFKKCGEAKYGCYVSDGTINIALLNFDHQPPGLPFGTMHFGIWVDDLEEAGKSATAAGGSYVGGNKSNDPRMHYEVKYRDIDGIVFDLTHSGWSGSVKEVIPAPEAVAAE